MAGGNLEITLADVAFVEGTEDLASAITEGAGFLGRRWRQTVRRARDLTVHRQRFDPGFAGKGRELVTRTEWMPITVLHDVEDALEVADAAGEPVRLIVDDGNRAGDYAVYVLSIEHDAPLEDYVSGVVIRYMIKDLWQE